MNAFSKIDMREVTRLTRAGKLGEAMAMLQGRAPASAAKESPKPQAPKANDTITIEMEPPAAPDQAWTASTPRRATAAADTPERPEHAPNLRARFPGMGGFFGAGKAPARQAQVTIPAGARFEERMFSNAAGSRSYKVYVPSGGAGQPLPVVVMLHGCSQNPDDFAAGTGMNEVAEELKFLVAYPRQPQSANLKKCWNWFNPEDQRRGGGEPSLIAGIAQQVVEEFSADAHRVYVAGLSAGGAAAAIMAATYPDVFAAVGIHSGLACGAARDMQSAFAAMGGKASVPSRGDAPMIPTIVFHGDADKTVNPINGDQIVAQARDGSALSKVVTHGETPAGMSYTRTVQRDADGRPALEQWVLHGAGHAWSGGSADGSYTDPRGPDASREMARFFLKQANA